MGKRSRNLPQTIGGASGKPKSTAQSGQDPFKQLLLNIQLDESSDSDSKEFQDSAGNYESTSVKKRAKTGHFQKAKKKEHSSSAGSTPAIPSPATNPTEFLTGGVRIKFPFTPYKSQQDMMSKIVEALQTQENALLESPTGSGKSLALLCGALAWLEAEKARTEEIRKEIRKNLEAELAKQNVVESPYFATEGAEPKPIVTSGCGTCPGSCGTETPSDVKLDSPAATSLRPSTADDQDFQSTPGQQMGSRAATMLQYEVDSPSNGAGGNDSTKGIPNLRESTTALPKIYFGSRTHKQITQLVKELKSNTVYRPRSRTHYCVNKRIQKAPNKNDACQELVEDDKCTFKFKANELQERFSVRKRGQNRIWDMEDLIEEGKAMRACPYFAARSLALGAELIFCPYSYLIDPQIRKAMDIDVENAIVILDEAHNIEDAAREAGGLDVLDNDLETAMTEFKHMKNNNVMAHPSQKLEEFADIFHTVLKNQKTFSIQEYEQSTEIWTSQELLRYLKDRRVDANSIETYNTACQEISKALKEKKEKKKLAKAAGPLLDMDMGMDDEPNGNNSREQFVAVTPRALRSLEGIIAILKRLFSADGYCLDDYKIALVESVDRSGTAREVESSTEAESDDSDAQAKKSRNAGRKKRSAGGGWQNYGGSAGWRGAVVAKKRELKFWCLNPGVIFLPLSSAARSVILTSGTLSPMDSFASELQTRFAVQLEAGHVVDQSQVWTGVLPYGPTRVKMDGTFKSASSFQFQDELGRAVERIIQTTPHGVLCFVSSYTLMDNLVNRWQSTGQYERLCSVKKVILEPRRATTKEFDKTLKSFYDHIASEVAKGSDGGALLFAVFRGKCSEGIDFTDSNCRAVLAVSIPYPGLNDLKIKLKKEYNDQQCQKRRQQSRGGQAGQPGAPIAGIANVNLQALNHSTGNAEQSAAHALAAFQDSVQSRALLSGKRWYDIQAFRAYNQAIGRCIRHRKDWGAMVLLDYRFTIPNTKNSLSKWVRPLVKTFNDFEVGMHNMKAWIQPLQLGIDINASADTLASTTTMVSAADSATSFSMVQSTHQVTESLALSVQNNHLLPHVRDEAKVKVEVPDVMALLDGNMIASISEDLIPKQEEEDVCDIPKEEKPYHQDTTDDYNTQDISLDHAWDDDFDVPSAVGHSTASGSHLASVLPTDKHDREASLGAQPGSGWDADMSGVAEEDLQEDALSPTFLSLEPTPAAIGGDGVQSQESGPDASSSSGRDETIIFAGGTNRTGLMENRDPESIFTAFPSSSPPRRDSTGNFARFTSNPQRPNTSTARTMAPRSWGNHAPQQSATPISNTGDTQSGHVYGGVDVMRVVCKTCNEPLLVCSERPKIKTVEKSMAAELLSHRRRLAAALEIQASTQASNGASQWNGVTPVEPASQRIPSGQQPSGVSSSSTMATSHPRAMILTVRGSCVLEKPFEGQDEQEELDCVWRPQDGLFYRRVVCARCHLVPATESAVVSSTANFMARHGQRIITGWKGVMIVGCSSGQQQTVGDDTDSIGTIWLTPGEIKVI
ncbi:Fanconi anemia group J protein [Mortierella sp. NVP41]|nr:Fanconi anemia group J protein [Mortierella sp. NVP41]